MTKCAFDVSPEEYAELAEIAQAKGFDSVPKMFKAMVVQYLQGKAYYMQTGPTALGVYKGQKVGIQALFELQAEMNRLKEASAANEN